MADLRRTVTFATGLYRPRSEFAWNGYVRRDPLSRLHLRIGRDDPYRIYETMRAQGPIVPTRLGNWATTSHRLCNTVLRDRRFGVRSGELSDTDAAGDDFDMSFLD